LVKKAIPNASFHIIGGGPFADELKLKVNERGLSLDVIFHGFIKDHREVESVLAGGAVAVATYIPEQADFTKFADPGKLKAYLAAGLPIVLTDVSPNAREIAEVAGGELVSYEPESIANKIITILSDPETWVQRNTAALTYVQQFDWNVILDRAFENLQSVTGGSK
jgi:glycosyltransferase involved in cell wall biosynthesis